MKDATTTTKAATDLEMPPASAVLEAILRKYDPREVFALSTDQLIQLLLNGSLAAGELAERMLANGYTGDHAELVALAGRMKQEADLALAVDRG